MATSNDDASSITHIRDSAKWLIAVFAAVGGVILTRVQFANLGTVNLTFGTMVGVSGTVLALASIGVMIWMAAKVLTPIHITLLDLDFSDPLLHETRTDNEKEMLSRQLEQSMEKFGFNGTLREYINRYRNMVCAFRAFHKEHQLQPNDRELEGRVDRILGELRQHEATMSNFCRARSWRGDIQEVQGYIQHRLSGFGYHGTITSLLTSRFTARKEWQEEYRIYREKVSKRQHDIDSTRIELLARECDYFDEVVKRVEMVAHFELSRRTFIHAVRSMFVAGGFAVTGILLAAWGLSTAGAAKEPVWGYPWLI